MSEQDIIDFLKASGPSTPTKFAKHANVSLLFASAMLGEVASKGLIRATNLKIGGGSPLYYVSEHAERLQDFSDSLNSKDRQAYLELKEKKILRDREQTPIIRISLRAIKDFAVPISSVVNGERELFWKWYLLNEKDAEEIVRRMLGMKKREAIPESKAAQPLPRKEPRGEALLKKEHETKQMQKKETERLKPQNRKEQVPGPLQEARPVPKSSPEKELGAKQALLTMEQGEDFGAKAGPFGKRVQAYLNEKKITIIRFEQVKKNREYNLILDVPSPIGRSKYFCKAINKKKIGEGELALAIVEAQARSLPSIVISTGELGKNCRMDSIFRDANFVKV